MAEIAKEEPKMDATQTQPEQTNPEILKTNYEEIIKQQQNQIEQLIKQQELNKKVNDQLTESLKSAQKTILSQGEEKDTRHWVDKQLEENFKFKAGFDLGQMQPSDTVPTEQIATWYMQYLKDNGCSNAEISNRIKNVFENKDIQENPKL